MDALLLALQNVCTQLVPIIGAVALIFLCILLKKAWILIDQATDKVKKLDPTIDLANQSMQKIQAPLDTAVKLSGTVDEIHDKAVDSAGKLSAAVTEGMDSLNEFVNDKFKKKDDVPFNPVETPVKPAEPEHKESQEEEAHE
jgi:predicted PurR-regulated permease PerM